jgi:hypothetical protein
MEIVHFLGAVTAWDQYCHGPNGQQAFFRFNAKNSSSAITKLHFYRRIPTKLLKPEWCSG